MYAVALSRAAQMRCCSTNSSRCVTMIAAVAGLCAHASLLLLRRTTATRTAAPSCATSMQRRGNSTSATTTTSAEESASAWPSSPAAVDWACACGFPNYAFRDYCFQCHAPRPRPRRSTSPTTTAATDASTSTGQQQQQQQQQQQRPFLVGDWSCSCGEHNFARRVSCRTCGHARPVPATAAELMQTATAVPAAAPSAAAASSARAAVTATQWTCTACYSVNRGAGVLGSVCAICGTEYDPTNATASPSAAAAAAPRSSSSSPLQSASSLSSSPHATAAPAAAQAGVHVSAYDARVPPRPMYTPRPDDWVCLQCGFANYASRALCKHCRFARPAGSSSGSSSGSSGSSTAAPSTTATTGAQQSIWSCGCGYLNYSTRTVCRECGAPRPSTPSHS